MGIVDFPGGSDGKASVYDAGDPGSDPWDGKIPWRRKWQSTPGLLPGKSHGQRSLVGKESDTTERLHFHLGGDSTVTIFWSGAETYRFGYHCSII